MRKYKDANKWMRLTKKQGENSEISFFVLLLHIGDMFEQVAYLWLNLSGWSQVYPKHSLFLCEIISVSSWYPASFQQLNQSTSVDVWSCWQTLSIPGERSLNLSKPSDFIHLYYEYLVKWIEECITSAEMWVFVASSLVRFLHLQQIYSEKDL